MIHQKPSKALSAIRMGLFRGASPTLFLVQIENKRQETMYIS